MSVKVVTSNPVRLSYPALFQPRAGAEPGSEPKYQATFLIPKTDTKTINDIQLAIQSEIQSASSAAGVWKGKAPAQPALTIYDGDAPNPNSGEDWGAECHGHYILRTSTGATYPPYVVNMQRQPITDAKDVYAGCYVYACFSMAAYDRKGKKGIGAFLNGVMFAGDGEPFGAYSDPNDDFASIPMAPAAPVVQNAPAAFPAGGFGATTGGPVNYAPASMTAPAQQSGMMPPMQPAYVPPAQQMYAPPQPQQVYAQPAPQPQTFGGFAPQTQPGAAPPIFGMGGNT